MAVEQGIKVRITCCNEISLPVLRVSYELEGHPYGNSQKGFMRWINERNNDKD